MKSDRKIWDWIILPSAQAQYEKNTTLGVSVDFQYSPPQLANENDPAQRPAFTQKRIQQYRTLITGFMQEFSKKD